MKIFRTEFHVHTVLSPCAEVEMIPPLIVREAIERGISLIAITDHNSSRNVYAVQKAAEATGLTVLPGMELQTREEVHILCLFDTIDQLVTWQAQVDDALPALSNRPELFGEQFVVDETGDYICDEPRLLLTSADIPLQTAVEEVARLGGLTIPAHVDRRAFGLIANLGFVPPDLPVAALEVSRHMRPSGAIQLFPQLASFPIIQGGDAHRLDELLGANNLYIEAPTLAEIRLAFSNSSGRTHTISA